MIDPVTGEVSVKKGLYLDPEQRESYTVSEQDVYSIVEIL